MKPDHKQCTYIIPLMIDSLDRENNIRFNVNYLLKNFDSKIIIPFFNQKPDLGENEKRISLYYCGKKAYNWRTYLANIGIAAAKTDYVCVFDADMIMDIQAYSDAVDILQNGAEIVLPYKVNVYNVDKQYVTDFNFDIEKVRAICPLLYMFNYGGAFWANRKALIKAGGENEKFISWGNEDRERIIRFQKLMLKIHYIDYSLWHFDHERTIDSSKTNNFYQANCEELEKVTKMTISQLRQYIKTWKHFSNI